MSYGRRHGLGNVVESPAGEINGVALLGADVSDLARRAAQLMGGVQFNRRAYERMQLEATARPGESPGDALERVSQRFERMSGDEVKQFIAGTVGQVASAVVRAKQLAELSVVTTAERNANHERQALVIEPARAMWQAASEVLRNMQAVQQQSAQSGLGIVIAPVVLVALVIAGAVLGATAIAALTYWADAGRRLEYASAEADRICSDAGGCNPEQAAAIRQRLQLGPWDSAAAAFGESAGRGLTVGLAVGGSVAFVAVIGYLGYRHFEKRLSDAAW